MVAVMALSKRGMLTKPGKVCIYSETGFALIVLILINDIQQNLSDSLQILIGFACIATKVVSVASGFVCLFRKQAGWRVKAVAVLNSIALQAFLIRSFISVYLNDHVVIS